MSETRARGQIRDVVEQATVAVDDAWRDDEDRPYGGWVEIGVDEWRGIIAHAGGLEALGVFSTLTDPEGVYGWPRIYTAWGRREDGHPLVDVDDEKDGGVTVRSTFRKFVLVPFAASSEIGGAR